jgi:hypothetical protein
MKTMEDYEFSNLQKEKTNLILKIENPSNYMKAEDKINDKKRLQEIEQKIREETQLRIKNKCEKTEKKLEEKSVEDVDEQIKKRVEEERKRIEELEKKEEKPQFEEKKEVNTNSINYDDFNIDESLSITEKIKKANELYEKAIALNKHFREVEIPKTIELKKKFREEMKRLRCIKNGSSKCYDYTIKYNADTGIFSTKIDDETIESKNILEVEKSITKKITDKKDD